MNDIEVAVEDALLDGMVCLASCGKTTPAHLLAAACLNASDASAYATGALFFVDGGATMA